MPSSFSPLRSIYPQSFLIRRLLSSGRRHPTSRPARIILIRHGESLGNVDESTYVNTPDWRVPLTPRGMQQASEAGRALTGIIGESSQVILYYSPYLRTSQTCRQVCQHLAEDQILSMREEPRISEQQFGNFQNEDEVQRYIDVANKLSRLQFLIIWIYLRKLICSILYHLFFIRYKHERHNFGRFYYRFKSGGMS